MSPEQEYTYKETTLQKRKEFDQALEERETSINTFKQAEKSGQKRKADSAFLNHLDTYKVAPEDDVITQIPLAQTIEEVTLESGMSTNGNIYLLQILGRDQQPIALSIKQFPREQEKYISIDIGYISGDGANLKSIGKFDFYIRGDKAYCGYARDATIEDSTQEYGNSDLHPKIDRSQVRTKEISLKTAPNYVEEMGTSRLGTAIISIGRAIAQQEGATQLIIEHDATITEDGDSFYVNKLGADLTEQIIPGTEIYKTVPTFSSTPNTEQPYIGGNWIDSWS